MNKVLLIIPAFNEQDNIGGLLNKIKMTHFPTQFTIHPLVINDGSTDNTESIVRSLGFEMLNLSSNLGIGATVQAGLIYAKENNFDFAVQVDGDGQHPASEINKLLYYSASSQDIDIVIGSRFITSEGFQSSFFRRLGISFFSLLLYVLTKKRYHDTTSGFRLFNRKAIAFFARYYPDDFPEPESLLIASIAGFNIQEVPVIMNHREGGVSSISRMKSVYYMTKVTLAILLTFSKYHNRFKDGSSYHL